MENQTFEQAALAVAGLVAPALTEILKHIEAVNGKLAVVIAAIIAVFLTVIVEVVVVGKVSLEEFVKDSAQVFTVSTLVYKLLMK